MYTVFDMQEMDTTPTVTAPDVTTEAPRLTLSGGFWDAGDVLESSVTQNGDNDSDSDMSGDEGQKTRVKNKTRREKLQEEREEEKKLFRVTQDRIIFLFLHSFTLGPL